MESHQRRRLLLVSVLLAINSLFQLSPASAAATSQPNGEDFIRESCKASLYPDLCYSSLSRFAGQVKGSPEKLAAVSISFCLTKVQPVRAHISDLSRKTSDPKISQSLKQCMESFDEAIDYIQKSIKEMKNVGSRGAIGNIKTWMSTVLTYEETCIEGFNSVPNGPVKKDVTSQSAEVEKFTSISLAMINLYARRS